MNQLAPKLRVGLRAFLHQQTAAMSASAKFLVDDPKYSFLKDLGIERSNSGVYNGKWTGSGPTTQSIDPATGSVIAEVTTGTVQELDECLAIGHEAYKVWSNMPAPYRGELNYKL